MGGDAVSYSGLWAAGELVELNRRMLDDLAKANRQQTERCRRMLGAVQLLGEVSASATVALGEQDEQVYVIDAELWDRINHYLADFAAVESEDRRQKTGDRPGGNPLEVVASGVGPQ